MSELKFVTLIDPNGVEVQVTGAVEINNLVYGQGYTIKGDATPDKAAETLAGNSEVVNATLNEEAPKKK